MICGAEAAVIAATASFSTISDMGGQPRAGVSVVAMAMTPIPATADAIALSFAGGSIANTTHAYLDG